MKIWRRGLSTVKSSRVTMPVWRNQAVIPGNSNREAPAAGPPILPAGSSKLAAGGNDTDLSQYYQGHVVTPIADSLDFGFAVFQMTMDEDNQGTATRTAAHSWPHRIYKLDLILESPSFCSVPKGVAMARLSSTIRLTCSKPKRGYSGRIVGNRMLGRFNLGLRALSTTISGDPKSRITLPSATAKRLRAKEYSISESTTPSSANSTITGIIYRVVSWPPLPQSIIQEPSDCIVAMQKIANEGQVVTPVVWNSPKTWIFRPCTIQVLFIDKPGRDNFTREKLVLSAHKVYTQCQRRTGFFGGNIIISDAHIFHLAIGATGPRGIGLEATE